MRIIISGTVGVGKSTTTKLLVEQLKERGYKVNHLEEKTVNSPYLTHYYNEPSKWAFIAQLDFLMERFKQIMHDENERDENTITIYDRHVVDDFIFAELHSIKRSINEFNSLTYHIVYKEVLNKILEMNAKPDIMFLLQADLETVMKRLNGRNRDAEMDTDMEYWKELYDAYYVKDGSINHFKNNVEDVMNIDTTNLTPQDTVEKILEIILNRRQYE